MDFYFNISMDSTYAGKYSTLRHATSSSLEIESLLIIINCKNKCYFWILNFKSLKYIKIISKIKIYLPKNWTSYHIDYSHKTMMAHGILMSFLTT